MEEKTPTNGALRNGVMDRLHQQIDSAGSLRVVPIEAGNLSLRQPGQDLRDPKKDTDDAE